MNKIFISTPLGFEMNTLAEMKECWPFLLGKNAKIHSQPFPAVQILQGGLEFETDMFIALQLNFFLKTANRVLLRMASFKAKDLPKFYQKFRSLPWLDFLTSAHVEWEIAAQKSRLNNEKRLQESAQKALAEIFAANIKNIAEFNPSACGSIYIRMDEDQCTISLDTTGEHLHKRGWSVLKGDAPLRETIAAFLLRETVGDSSPAELSQVTLFDPMMGAGTFLTEARSLWQGQFKRSYAFQKWKRAPKLFLSESFIFNYELPTSLQFKDFVGMDIQEKMLIVSQTNFLQVEEHIKSQEKNKFQSAILKLMHQDCLTGDPIVANRLWMIMNPPYGERLSGEYLGDFNQWAQKLCQRYRPQKIGILNLEKEKLKMVPKGYRIEKELKVNNGGLRCLFTLLAVL